MLNRTKVVMLSTNEKAKITGYRGGLFLNPMLIDRETKFYHLYFLSDEEIKEGDLVIGVEKDYGIYNQIHQVKVIKKLPDGDLFWFNDNENGISAIPEHCKKVIATTDSSLTIYRGGFNMGKSLPKPSDSFIQKYISEYNKDNIIEYVNVEYNVYGPIWKEKWELKVDKNNEITIKPIKSSWSRDEVILLCKSAFIDGTYSGGLGPREESIESELNEWIEENL